MNYNLKNINLLKCILVGLTFFLLACGLPKSTVNYKRYYKLTVGAGPEDFVLDTLSTTSPRILVSCAERWEKTHRGSIYQLDVKTEKASALERKGEPSSLTFWPHGIDIVKGNDGIVRLYVINHNDAEKEQAVLVYTVHKNYLQFETKLITPLFTSPNDVTATASGDIYVTNDTHTRGGKSEALFKLKKGKTVYFHLNNWDVFSKYYCYANGILTFDNKLFISTTRQNKLFYHDLNNPKKEILFTRMKGQDNISKDGNFLYITAHLKQIKFLKYVKDSTKFSPSVVYKVDLSNGKKTCVFSDDGKNISTASTAIHFKNKLYICQIFEGYILVCEE